MKNHLFHALFLCATLLLLPSCSTRAQTNNPTTQQAADPKTETFRDQIRDLIAAGHTEAALRLWVETGDQNAKLLQKQFDAAKEQYSKGLIDYADWSRTQAQINYTILELTPGNSPETKTVAIPREQIKKLAHAGKLEDALRLLFPAKPDDSALVLARIKTARKYYELGTIDSENFEQIEAQITMAILEMSRE